MPPRKSKSKEREIKRRQREKLSEENKELLRKNDAKSKIEMRKLESDKKKKERLEWMAAYKARRADASPGELIVKRRKRLRLEKGIGLNDGVAASWISKSMEEMTHEERKEYNSHLKRRSREHETEEKKEDLKKQYRKDNYKRRFARFRQEKTLDLRDSDEKEHENCGDMLTRYLKWKETGIRKYPFNLSKHEESALQKVRAGEKV